MEHPLHKSATGANASPQPPRSNAQMTGAPSTRFAKELRHIIQSAQDQTNLRSLLLDCLQRNRVGLGAVWLGPNQQAGMNALVQRLPDERHQHQRVKKFMAEVVQRAVRTKTDIVMSRRDLGGITCTAIHVTATQPNEMLALLRSSTDQHTIDHDALIGHDVAEAIGHWQLQRRINEGIDKLDAISAVLDLITRIESSRCIDEAARTISDSVRDYLDCSFVAIGLKGNGRLTSRIQAVSGVADFDPHSVRSQRIRAALDEAIARDGTCRWADIPLRRASDDLPHTQNLAQHKLAEQANCQCVVSIPLRDVNNRAMGAVTIGGSRRLTSRRVENFLTAADPSVGNAIASVQRSQQSAPRRLVRQAIGTGRFKAFAMLAVFCVAIGLMWLPVPYRIACRFECQPVERRSAVAPYDGLLKETLVRPGDVVEVNQELAVMDDRELRFELTGLIAEMERARTEQKVQLANEKIGASLMASLEVDQVKSRRELVEHRLQNLVIRSSMDGLVLSGGIDRKENYPVHVGELLYEIAPLDRIRFDLAVPAEEIAHISKGMKVELRTDHRVTNPIEATITRIRPRSEAVSGDNVFVAEVEIDNAENALRPGMEGSARIVSSNQQLGWILFHRAFDHIVTRWRW